MRMTRELEGYMSALAHPMRAQVETVLVAMLSEDADIAAGVKWNAPSFTWKGEDRVTFRLHPKGWLQLILHRGAKPRDGAFAFEDPTGLITWLAPDRGMIELRDSTAVATNLPAVVAVSRAWMVATA
ncbi:DUF1801 domain-containing protein [Caulobacter segnis]|uniref:DUF1801 domain-containing protein n=1 Tax=Caulobacter segnis TaxID=88688 RepID=UPI002410A807|nr:DUF1801 domain-containing protein [Caulobacter segnis]MDG2522240.1 DUF1801 domain-containing protein [Caulobacter segnis]